MYLDKYAIVSDATHQTYEFLSEGVRGTIKKFVLYQEIGDNVFNLAFGDWDEIEQKINYKARSNNNDRNKVITTVASTVIDFIEHHPKATIFAKGHTAGRTRLYQIGIFANWVETSNIFDVEGFIEERWEPIQKQRN